MILEPKTTDDDINDYVPKEYVLSHEAWDRLPSVYVTDDMIKSCGYFTVSINQLPSISGYDVNDIDEWLFDTLGDYDWVTTDENYFFIHEEHKLALMMRWA